MLKGTLKLPDPDPLYRRHSWKGDDETTISLTRKNVIAVGAFCLVCYLVVTGQAGIGQLFGLLRFLGLPG